MKTRQPKKLKEMENEFGLKHTDDLAIIRLIKPLGADL